MKSFWNSFIHPILLRRRPRCIVEIGAGRGATTRLLLDYCESHDAVLHTIDPQPRFNIDTWQQEHGKRLTIHRMRSLDALPLIASFDVVLIDGDHNWYTVFHELRLLDQLSGSCERPFPLVFLHDVSWPYGRRDLYYHPESIPPNHRHPFERKGVAHGVSELQEKGGLNPDLFNACHEGGPCNGVLTAIEDFLQATALPLRLITIPGFFGLGILYLQVNAHDEELGAFLQGLDLPTNIRRHIAEMETFGISSQLRIGELLDRLKLMMRDKRHQQGPQRDGN